jgi:hypothetical protein
MKIRLLTLFLAFTLSIAMVPSESQAAGNYHNAISIDPLSFLIGGSLFATYEYQLSATNSLTVMGGYYGHNYGGYGYDWSYTEISIGASYRWYLKLFDDKKKPIEGLSAGPFALVTIASSSSSWSGFSEVSGTYFTIGAEVAYKWNFDNWFVEPIIRIGFPVSKISGFSDYRTGGGGVNVGYAW